MDARSILSMKNSPGWFLVVTASSLVIIALSAVVSVLIHARDGRWAAALGGSALAVIDTRSGTVCNAGAESVCFDVAQSRIFVIRDQRESTA